MLYRSTLQPTVTVQALWLYLPIHVLAASCILTLSTFIFYHFKAEHTTDCNRKYAMLGCETQT